MLAPVAGIVHTGNHLGADRNTYVPCMGFALLFGALAASVVRAWRRGALRTPIVAVSVGIGALWIGGLALGARAQSSVWRDSETLWRYAITVDPGCAICHHNLGIILASRGDLTGAQALLDRAIALRPDRSEFHGSYGPVLIQMGRRPEGVAKLHYRLGDNPRDVTARVNLGISLIEDGRPGEAIVELDRALRVKPDSLPALTSLGRALLADGRADPARAAFERAIAINAADPVAHLGLARAHLARGDRAAAQEQIPILERLDPQRARMLEQEIR
jgi:Flp pilus assembly protein TadD